MKTSIKIVLLFVIVLILVGICLILTSKKLPEQGEQNNSQPKEELSLREDDKKVEVASEKSEVSFQSLVNRSYTAPALTLGEIIQTTSAYTKRAVTYKSDDLTISGVIYIPTEEAPQTGYPVLITNHGYIDPSVYTTGRGLKREQEYFANRGYVVLHPDYRNHAGSTKTNDDPIQDRLGYITDIIHSVIALKNSSVSINKEDITLLGHSMGGGATLAAALIQPNIANRIVLYAPVTVNYLDSYNRYQKDDPRRAEVISVVYGTPESNPDFWEGLNGEPFFDRLNVPVQIYHGTADPDVPYEWSTDARDVLLQKGKDVEFITYEGEKHEFSFAWTQFMQGVEAFTKK